MWDLLIVRPIINLLLLFYKFLGNETVVAVALVTLLSRVIIAPMMLKQQKSIREQQSLRPKLEALQKKYKDDKEKLAQEQMKLYQEMGINPLSGCLPILIQLPLMIGVYQAIIRSLAATPLQLLALSKDIWVPGLSLLLPLKSHFLWLDLALPDPIYVLPFLVFITSWYYQKLLTPPATDAQTESMNKQMTIMMPIFTAFITLNYASGLAVYFIISNLVGLLQYYIFRDHYAPPVAATAQEASLFGATKGDVDILDTGGMATKKRGRPRD